MTPSLEIRKPAVGIEFERTFDLDLVRMIATHPKIWPHISDDGAGKAEDYRPADHPSIWYVTVLRDRELMGLWAFMPENSVCWSMHTLLLPHSWGKFSHEALPKLFRWMWDNTTCRRIVGTAPVTNRLVINFVKSAGMAEYGLNPASYLKNGVLLDQVLLGISRPKESN